jgi:hypothetical protein
MDFLTELKKQTNVTYTENMAKTNRSSLDANLDFFALAGAMRNNQQMAISLFEDAYRTDKLTAIKTMFYLRDIRGGQGERSLFRAFLSSLYKLDPEVAEKVLVYIPTYGRWDDLPLTSSAIELIALQFDLDEAAMKDGKNVSLMAKWLPSENTSSKRSKKTARELAKALNLTPAEYRRKVVKLRKYIKLLEQKMSAKDWDIDYSQIPSQALRKHTKAFQKHDPEGYSAFLAAVDKGEKKINVSTLYTYEVLNMLWKDEATANTMWNNLPDYTPGKNALVICDVSGSMGMLGYARYGGGPSPIDVSVSLALYFAERNEGLFKNYFLTFSAISKLVEIKGSTLMEKVLNINQSDWGMNTNIMSAFRTILNAAIAAKASEHEVPSTIFIISDMQFDACTSGNDKTNFELAKKEYEQAGFSLPHVVFWNVEARNREVPATIADGYVTLISGLSQSTFRYAVEGKSPRESMDDILNSDRYAQIVI